MAKLRIAVGVERRIRIINLAKTWTDNDNMFVQSEDGEVFFRSLKYFPTQRHGWEKQLPNQVMHIPKPAGDMPNLAVMRATSASVYCAAYISTSLEYKYVDPDNFSYAVNCGIVFG